MGDKPLIAVWFSCGAASAVAAHITLKKYAGDYAVRVVNNPIQEEHEDNRRFLNDVREWLGVPIESAVSPKYPHQSCETVWRDRKFMSSPYGAPCTLELKKKAREAWEDAYKPDYHVLGFTAEERDRRERFIKTERGNVLPVLIDENLTKDDCLAILLSNGIKPPVVYEMGLPNANCLGCVKATSPTYWNLIREKFPHVFEQRAVTSREIGAKLVRYKGKRIFLDELPEDAKGAPIIKHTGQCGIFCEEWLGD